MKYVRKLYRRLADDGGGTGTVDRSTMAFRATPWVERETGGGFTLYTGRDGSLWLYAVVRNFPLYYEDDAAILDAGRRVENVLHEIGKTSLSRAFGIRSTASYRDIHVLSVRWEGTPEVPPGHRDPGRGGVPRRRARRPARPPAGHVPRGQAPGPRRHGRRPVPIDRRHDRRARGVGCWATSRPTTRRSSPTAGTSPRSCAATSAGRPRMPNAAAWRRGSTTVVTPSPRSSACPTSWSSRRGTRSSSWRWSGSGRRCSPAPDAMWLADAFNLDHGPQVVSLRAQLQTGEDTNRDLRRSVRRQSQDARGRTHQQPPRRGRRGERAAGVHPGGPPEYAQGRDMPSCTAARWCSGGGPRRARQRDVRRVPGRIVRHRDQPLGSPPDAGPRRGAAHVPGAVLAVAAAAQPGMVAYSGVA